MSVIPCFPIHNKPQISLSDLPTEDGEPLESPQHRIAMNALIQSLKQAWSNRTDYFVGGNMFVYFSPDQELTKDYRGPDFFVVLNTTLQKRREAWIIWEEQGRTPDLVVELLSKSTKHFDLNDKKAIYEQILKTPDYFVFDPFDPDSLQGWHLVKQRYQALLPNKHGWLWSETLQLWLGTWEGQVEQDTGVWLRFYDSQGQLLLLPEEQVQRERQQKEQERQQKEFAQQQLKQLQDKLRAQGIKIDEL